MGMVSAKVTPFFPPVIDVSLLIALFEIAVRLSSTMRVTAKTAYRSGSSQHGKARRASVGSNCVVAMTCSAPPESRYVLR